MTDNITSILRARSRVVLPAQNCPTPTQDDDANSRKKTTDIEEWDQKFREADQEMLFEIILAANYMDTKALLGSRHRGV